MGRARCPACGEWTFDGAAKCAHCGAWRDGRPGPEPGEGRPVEDQARELLALDALEREGEAAPRRTNPAFRPWKPRWPRQPWLAGVVLVAVLAAMFIDDVTVRRICITAVGVLGIGGWLAWQLRLVLRSLD